MLDFLRKSANSIVVKVLLGLLIVSFAAWGIGDIFRARGSSNAVVTVGDTEIGIDSFRAEFASELNRLSQSMGQPIPREQAIAMGLDGMVLDRMISLQVLHAGANDMELMASDQVVAQEIKQTKEFFNKDGQFDRRIYTDLLSRAGLSEDRYVAQVRDGVVRMQFLSPIAGGMDAPKAMIDTLYKLAAETRVLDVVRISHVKVKGVPAPSGAELSQYHQDNADRFMAPEYRALTALVLTADDVSQGIQITEDELRAAYDERAAEFTTPETRALSQILVKDEAAAQAAAAKLDGGEAPKLMKLGKFTRAEAEALSAEIADAAFTTPKGGHSQPVKSPLGWHVLVVDGIEAGSARSLDDVREELTQALRAERAIDVLFQTSNDLEDMLGGGQTLEEAAQGLNVKLVQLAQVDANAQGADGKPVDAPYAADLVAKGFELGDGQESLLTEGRDSKAYFVVRVDGVTAPALRPLETVEKAVAAAWTQERRAEQAAKIAEDAKTRLEAGESAQAVAKALGFDAFTTEPFNRAGMGLQQGALPATLISNAFTLASGGIALAEGTGAHTVAVLKTVNAAEVDPSSGIYQAIHDRVLRDMQGDLVQQWSAALQERHPVRVNQRVLQDFAN